jgi:hypothetical protein
MLAAAVVCLASSTPAWDRGVALAPVIRSAWLALGAAYVAQLVARRLWKLDLTGRKQRVQLSLEFGLFWWRELGPRPEVRSNALLDFLFRAAKATRDAKLRTEILEILRDGLRTPPDLDEADIDRRLRALIGRQAALEHPLARDPRRVSRYHFPVIVDLFRKLILTAVGSILLLWQMPGATRAQQLCGLAVLAALVDVAVTIGSSFGAKVSLRRAQSAFRTVFVTDRPGTDPLCQDAVPAFAAVGHAIVVLVNERGEPDSVDFNAVGPDIFFPSPDGTRAVLETFIDHADLLVIYATNPALAALGLELTSLPIARRLALSIDRSVPPGYRWLNSSALSRDTLLEGLRQSAQVDPATRRGSGAAHDKLMWGDPLFAALIPLGLWLQLDSSWRPIGWFLIVAAAGWLFPRFLGPRRRANVSPHRLRAPRAPRFSRALSRPWKYRVPTTLGLALATYAAARAVTGGGGWTIPLHVGLLTSVQLGVIEGGIRAIKWSLDWNFRIIVLRRNSAETAESHQNTVMTTCGAYGQVIFIDDQNLRSVNKPLPFWRVKELPFWRAYDIALSEIYAPLDGSELLHEWQHQVAAELDRADFAVFDWQASITDNMVWELHAAIARLPAERILVMYTGRNESAVLAILAKVRQLRDAAGFRLERVESHFLPVQQRASFAERFYDIMRNLEPAPRPRGE